MKHRDILVLSLLLPLLYGCLSTTTTSTNTAAPTPRMSWSERNELERQKRKAEKLAEYQEKKDAYNKQAVSRNILAQEGGYKGYKAVNLSEVLYKICEGKETLENYLGYIIFGQGPRVLQITKDFVIYEHGAVDTRGITAWIKKEPGKRYYRNQKLNTSQYLIKDFTNYVNNVGGTATGIIVKENPLDNEKNLFKPFAPIL